MDLIWYSTIPYRSMTGMGSGIDSIFLDFYIIVGYWLYLWPERMINFFHPSDPVLHNFLNMVFKSWPMLNWKKMAKEL